MSPPTAAALPISGDWHALIEAMTDAVWLVDSRRLLLVGANRAAGTLMGIEPQRLLGMRAQQLACTPEDVCFWDEALAGQRDSIESDSLLRRFDGSIVSVSRSIARVEPAQGAPLYLVVLRDRSEPVRLERELEVASAMLAATLESTADGLLVTDLSGRIRHFNRRFAELWNVPEALLQQRDDDALFDWMRRSVTEPQAYMHRLSAIQDATLAQVSDTIELHSGRVLERVTTPQCSLGQPIGRVQSFRDLTEKIESRRRIDALSRTDALTGLSNRGALGDAVAGAERRAARDGTPFALLLVNLDRFRHVNDTLGHAFGDRVLQDVAKRLSGCVRQVDEVARLGADEFALLLQQSDAAGAEAGARRVMDALQPPFTHDGLGFTLTASIGITLGPRPGGNIDELLDRADVAVHEVKRSGRAGWRFHHESARPADGRARTRLRLDHAMRSALVQGRFRLHYQPQIDLRSGRMCGAEALLRWRDPEFGDVSPGEFIPVAEESGFIVPIGDWVLREAVRQAAIWRDQGHDFPVAVNVSALQFRQPGFVGGVAAALRDAGLPPGSLELEVTESVLIQDAQDALERLQALAQLGVRLSVDDFGTGYSSLTYLKRLPIGLIKIDRSFVGGLPEDTGDAGIVRAIIDLGRALGLKVLAEGVETEVQRHFLRQAGCDLFQGFLYAPALDPVAFEERLSRHRLPGTPAVRLVGT